VIRHLSDRRQAGAAAAGLCLVLLSLSVVLPAAVLGHAELDTPTPADKSTVTQPVVQVSGTFTEAVKADGSSLRVKDASGTTVAQGGVDPSDPKVMLASPTNPLVNGAYTVEWTTISAADGDVARGTWTFTVAVAPSPSSTPTAGASASAAPTTAPTPTPAPSAAPSPSPSGTGDPTGSGRDVILPIIVALIILGAGAAYLLSRRERPASGT
jgi:methionine-rich copper-binding protein CopC